MNGLDWVVLCATILGIAAYGIWKTRGQRELNRYLHGDRDTSWIVIGISVMATQASAITFLSTPGQGFEDGLGFMQVYYGAPFALILIAMVFLPIFRRLNVYTAYEYLGTRFDAKTRLLGTTIFLLNRGLGAGITIYAPAIVLSTVMGWRLDATIILSGLVVTIYTVSGGTAAVNLTQRYQFLVIFIGMATAFFILISKLSQDMSFTDALSVAGKLNKLEAVKYQFEFKDRYSFWSGMIGGMFLALSYFGTDQSQVQRYLSGTSLRESRLGLMFNAVFKIPMQFFILLLGVMLFMFYQFDRPPVFFNQSDWQRAKQQGPEYANRLEALEERFATEHRDRQLAIRRWIESRQTPGTESETAALEEMKLAAERVANTRRQTKETVYAALQSAKGIKPPGPNEKPKQAKDSDYVFITFILNNLPHGIIGLLIAVFFAATLSSKAGELNALASSTTVDLYRQLVRPGASDWHYVYASKLFTLMWGLIAIGLALCLTMAENLIEATNIVSSVFYGVPLALFLTAFFLKWVHGTAVFWSAILTQAFVIVCYFTLTIGYLWYNAIGCIICMLLSVVIQKILDSQRTMETNGLEISNTS